MATVADPKRIPSVLTSFTPGGWCRAPWAVGKVHASEKIIAVDEVAGVEAEAEVVGFSGVMHTCRSTGIRSEIFP